MWKKVLGIYCPEGLLPFPEALEIKDGFDW